MSRKKCQVGCIACGICVKTCPVDAIKIDNNLARIDHSKCIVCGLCVKKCPTKRNLTITSLYGRKLTSIPQSA